MTYIHFDDLEVRSRWWSAGPENKDGVAQRLTAFLHQVQYAPVESVVLVGHSHWIRELLKANLNPCVAEKDAAFASQLTKQKLSNCGRVRSLVFRSLGGASADMHLLMRTLANDGESRAWAALG